MNITIEHSCSQCGAPVELGESDHILACPYCDVTSCLSTNMPSLLLPPREKYDQMVYVPYMRFRGSVYSCTSSAISQQVVDTSLIGIPQFTMLQPSLGIRPQAMKLFFATHKLPGSFLKCFSSVDQTIERAGSLQKIERDQQLFHRAYIGETVSLIYQPLFLDGNKLGDAVSGDLLANLPKGFDSLSRAIDPSPPLDLEFIPTICPQCGWNLSAASDSVVLTCLNCHTAWEANGRKFTKIECVSLSCTDEETIFLPFWKIGLNFEGIELDSFADFVKLANLPVVPKPDWQDRTIQFWIPAFKVRPKIYLRLATQLSAMTEEMQGEHVIEEKSYPVNMPYKEALESVKVVLANSSARPKSLLPRLPAITIAVTSKTLFYLPFDNSGYDLRQKETRVSINRQILAWGRYL